MRSSHHTQLMQLLGACCHIGWLKQQIALLGGQLSRCSVSGTLCHDVAYIVLFNRHSAVQLDQIEVEFNSTKLGLSWLYYAVLCRNIVGC